LPEVVAAPRGGRNVLEHLPKKERKAVGRLHLAGNLLRQGSEGTTKAGRRPRGAISWGGSENLCPFRLPAKTPRQGRNYGRI